MCHLISISYHLGGLLTYKCLKEETKATLQASSGVQTRVHVFNAPEEQEHWSRVSDCSSVSHHPGPCLGIHRLRFVWTQLLTESQEEGFNHFLLHWNISAGTISVKQQKRELIYVPFLTCDHEL